MFGKVLKVSRTPEEEANFKKAGYDPALEGTTDLVGRVSSDAADRLGGPDGGVGPKRAGENGDEVRIRYRMESDESAAAESSKVVERAARSESAFIEKVAGSADAVSAGGVVGAGGGGVRFSQQPGDADTAVLVCHGMGEQVRYDTISLVAEAIREQAIADKPQKVGMVSVLSRDQDDFLAHAQMSWTDKQNQPHKVDVYEAYWAPVTEGQVSYYDTLKFLFSAGVRGLWWSIPRIKGGFRRSLRRRFRDTFLRWMFGGPKEMEIQKRSFPGLLGMLLFLLFVVGLIAAASWWVARELTGFASIRDPWVAVKHALHTFHGWWKLGFRITVKQTWFAAWRMLSSVGSWVWRTKAWLVIVAIGFFLRYFIVEYVGDVAAYISPYKDSKFDEIRHTIQQIGLNVGKTIYGFGTATPNVPYYKQVVIVGHSLGSVLAYDTLNALLNLDNVLAPGDRRDVADRTRALITMGSPLDKTAFLFRMQARSNQNWIREAMAAAVQPLIVSYPDYRRKTFDWVNIWSPMDIISGELNYYDDPALRPNVAPCVQNHIDRQDRWWPIIAHVKYFGHKEFHKWLYTFVT